MERGGVIAVVLKNKGGDIIGVRFEKGNNNDRTQEDFKKLINELILNAE